MRPADAVPEEWDAGLRLSDRVTNHLLADREGNRGRWIVARLADGGADPDTTYDTRVDAICAQLHPAYYAYVRLPWTAMSPRSAHLYLVTHRDMHGAGVRLAVEERAIILPARNELIARIAPRAFRGETGR